MKLEHYLAASGWSRDEMELNMEKIILKKYPEQTSL